MSLANEADPTGEEHSEPDCVVWLEFFGISKALAQDSGNVIVACDEANDSG